MLETGTCTKRAYLHHQMCIRDRGQNRDKRKDKGEGKGEDKGKGEGGKRERALSLGAPARAAERLETLHPDPVDRPAGGKGAVSYTHLPTSPRRSTAGSAPTTAT